MEQILNEIEMVKWLLVALILMSGLIGVGILYIIYKTTNPATKAALPRNFSDKAKDLLDKGKPDEAVKLAKSRIESHPKDKYAHWYLAMAYQEQKEYIKALETFAVLKKIAPIWAEKYVDPYVNYIKRTLKNTKPELL